MRCGCPHCQGYMIQCESERKDCVCPDCGYRCHACQGTNTVMSLEEIQSRQEELLRSLQESGSQAEEEDW